MSKFQRKYKLTVETITGDKIIIEDPLTLDFQITRNDFASANTAEFVVYNLGSVTRNRIYKNKWQFVFQSVKLQAGYSEQLPVVFDGNINEAYSYKEQGSVDFLTSINCFDGGFDIAEGYSSFALTGERKKDEVVDRLIKDLKHTKRGVITSLIEPKASPDEEDVPLVHPRGVSVMGNTMNKLQEETGDAAFIDLGTINILKSNECIQGDILILKASTGLLGSPKRTGTLIIVQMLFEPRIKIGQQISLESQTQKSYNGVYKVIGFNHSGTISGSVGGNCQTTVSLWYGESSGLNRELEVISGRE